MLDFAQARRTMVDCQIRTVDVTDRALLAALDEVPREAFVPNSRREFAYADFDMPLPGTEHGRRVILKATVVARLIQVLEVSPNARVLDVAGAYGYSAALFSALGAAVLALESPEALAAEARTRLRGAATPDRVEVRTGPLDQGCPDAGPYDAILINGAVEKRPEALLQQLRSGGRLACLRQDATVSRAVLFVRSGSAFSERVLFDATAPVLPEFARTVEFSF